MQQKPDILSAIAQLKTPSAWRPSTVSVALVGLTMIATSLGVVGDLTAVWARLVAGFCGWTLLAVCSSWETGRPLIRFPRATPPMMPSAPIVPEGYELKPKVEPKVVNVKDETAVIREIEGKE